MSVMPNPSERATRDEWARADELVKQRDTLAADAAVICHRPWPRLPPRTVSDPGHQTPPLTYSDRQPEPAKVEQFWLGFCACCEAGHRACPAHPL